MFLVAFALFIRVFTSFQSLIWGLVFLIIAVGGVSLYAFFSKKGLKSWIKMLGLVLLAWILSMGSVLLFFWQNTDQLWTRFWSLWLQKEFTKSKFEPIIGEVEVLEQTKKDRYVVKLLENAQHYTLKTEKILDIWAKYMIWWSMRPMDLGLTYGERFFFTGTGNLAEKFADFLSYEFSYEKRMLMKGYQGAIYPKFILKITPPIVSKSRILTARSWVRNQVSTFFNPKTWALLLGMLIWDKSQLENAQYQQFVESGIVHIIAVSWWNLVMIVVFLGGILFFLPFYLRNALIISGVCAFALIAGGDSSVVRALIMTVLSLLALFWGREVEIWRLMKYAFVLMLCYNPYFLAYDLWFLLSFGALIGIVSISERYGLRRHSGELGSWGAMLNKLVKEYFLPTVWASLGTLPILLFFIGSTNLTGILINLLIVPLVPIITIGGFISILLGSMTEWTWWSLPISWLLELIFELSALAESWALRIEVQNMWVRWWLLLVLIGILVCIVSIVKEEKEKLE